MASGRRTSLDSDGRRARSSSSARTGRAERRYSSAPARGASSSRVWYALLLFVLVGAVLIVRVGYLAIIAGPSNAEDAIAARTVTVANDAKRGTIYDRNGTVLATSVEATTVYCNPYEVKDAKGTANQIAALLGGSPGDYIDALQAQDTSFAYVKRKIDTDAADLLKNMKLDGVYFLSDTKRVYPCGQIAGQVVGLCDTDGNGISGLELYYNDILAGTAGKSQVERGGKGYPIAGGLTEITPSQDGQDIVVSLDIEMQEYVETRLAQGVADIEGKRGDAIVYDGSTGEILACASTPYLNPADRSSIEEGATTLMPVNTQYEPGSIFKAITMAAVLEGGELTPASEIWCPTYLPADEYTVTDAHTRPAGDYTLSNILAASSNIGTSLAAERLGFGPLYNKIIEYGFAQKTGVDFPGEATGYCAEQSTWSHIRSYNVSFGQGVMVTPMQMARFYGAIANNGTACQPHFLISYPQTGETPAYATTQIIQNTDILPGLEQMLVGVTTSDEGTGKKAAIEGYEVAGKTGTAQWADDSGKYVSGSYDISFIGYLANTDSNIVCFVGATDVPGDRQTTLPFKDIMSFAINHYRITAQ